MVDFLKCFQFMMSAKNKALVLIQYSTFSDKWQTKGRPAGRHFL